MNSANPMPDIQAPRAYAEDEIDLLELFGVLWGGRWLIAAVTFLVFLVTIGLLMSMPSIYRVEAVLSGPSKYNLQVIEPSRLEVEEVVESEAKERTNDFYQVASVQPVDLYRTALAYAESLHTQRRFWDQRGQSLVPPKGERSGPEAFASFVKRLEIEPPEKVQSGEALTRIWLDSEHPESAQALLSGYVDFISEYTVQQQLAQLASVYETNLDRLSADYQSIQQREKLRLQDRLTRLREAYGVAKSLGIRETPYEQVENVQLSILDNRLYLLGTSALGEEITALQTRAQGTLEPFVPELRLLERWKGQLTSDLQRLREAGDDLDALLVLSPPEASLQPVAPNKPLILVASLFGAFLLGVILVFARHAIDAYRSRFGTSDRRDQEVDSNPDSNATSSSA